MNSSRQFNPTQGLFQTLDSGNEPDIIIIKKYLDDGADLSARDNAGNTPIMLACQKGYWNIVKLIADTKKTDTNDSFDYGDALRHLVSNNEVNIDEEHACADSLLKAGATREIRMGMRYTDTGRTTVLHLAVLKGRENLVLLLLSFGANLSVKDQTGTTPIMLACQKGYWNIVKLIADTKKTDTNDSFDYGDALLRLVNNNEVEIDEEHACADSLLKAGATREIRMGMRYTDTGRTSVLHLAVLKGRENLVLLLLSFGANLSVKDQTGTTPIMLACQKGYWNIVKLIADTKKTDTNDSFDYGDALLRLVNNNEVEIDEQYYCAYSLLKAGALTRKNFCFDSQNNTALHIAVLNGRQYLVSLLLSFGADRECKNYDRKVPKDMNPECFDKGSLINPYNFFIPGILIVLCQGIRQKQNIINLFLNNDILPIILNHVGAGSIISTMRTPENILNTLNTLERTRVTCLTEEYNKLRFFETEQLTFGRSSESKELVKNLDRDKDSPDKIKQHINGFFNSKSLKDLEKKSRLVDLLKKYHYIDDTAISQYKKRCTK